MKPTSMAVAVAWGLICFVFPFDLSNPHDASGIEHEVDRDPARPMQSANAVLRAGTALRQQVHICA